MGPCNSAKQFRTLYVNMLYCRLIYILSILCVRLTIKVKVVIPESFKVGWYPPPQKKKKKTGSSHLNRPKNRNNSLIRDQKSNKHIANGYKYGYNHRRLVSSVGIAPVCGAGGRARALVQTPAGRTLRVFK